MSGYITDPLAIEKKSMQIIEEELGSRADRFSPEELALVKRVIHTTADFEYADLFHSAHEAIGSALETFRSGSFDVVSDTNMIVAGTSKNLLSKYGGRIHCLVADRETQSLAEEQKVTRSMINIRRAVAGYPRAIFAIGNAPTALYELIDQIEKGAAEPRLVIAVPVGFVEARESKEALEKVAVPQITIRGRKGGSTVAVAILNALLRLAGE